MQLALSVGGMIVLAGLGIWIAIAEAKTGATQREAAKTMKEVIDAYKRFEKARRDSAGLPRVERLALMLQELREGNGSSLPKVE